MQTLRQKIPIVLLVLIAPLAFAQKNDFGFTLGGYIAASSPLNLGAAGALEGSYARRVASVPAISLSAELPIAESFTSSVPTLNGLTLARSYTSLFITPGARVRLAPSFFISTYLAAGLGYGRFNRKLFDGTTSASGAFVLDVGGGLDIKILPFISLRGEIRDFNSTSPGLESLFSAGRQDNLFFTLGVGVRF